MSKNKKELEEIKFREAIKKAIDSRDMQFFFTDTNMIKAASFGSDSATFKAFSDGMKSVTVADHKATVKAEAAKRKEHAVINSARNTYKRHLYTRFLLPLVKPSINKTSPLTHAIAQIDRAMGHTIHGLSQLNSSQVVCLSEPYKVRTKSRTTGEVSLVDKVLEYSVREVPFDSSDLTAYAEHKATIRKESKAKREAEANSE